MKRPQIKWNLVKSLTTCGFVNVSVCEGVGCCRCCGSSGLPVHTLEISEFKIAIILLFTMIWRPLSSKRKTVICNVFINLFNLSLVHLMLHSQIKWIETRWDCFAP